MLTKQFAEVPYPKTNDVEDPTRPVFVVIETRANRVFLNQYNGNGYLLSETAHASLDAAHAAARQEFPALSDWRLFTEDCSSIALAAQERQRRRLADGADTVIPYGRVPRAKSWWRQPRGFLGEILTSIPLLVAFNLAYLPPTYLGRLFWEDLSSRGDHGGLALLGEVGMFCTIVSVAMWQFPTPHFFLGMVGLAALAGFACLAILSVFTYMPAAGLFLAATYLPFFLLLAWRGKWVWDGGAG